MILYHGSNVEIEAIDFANDNIGMQMRKIDADLRTGLYSQSTAYVYSILETEILTGKLG